MKRQICTVILFLSAFFTVDVTAQPITLAVDTIDDCTEGNRLLVNFQFAEALEQFEICCSSEPTNTGCLRKIALCNYRLGRYPKAVHYNQLILERDSGNVTAKNQLAAIFSKQGYHDEARQQFIELVAIDPNNSYYYEQIASLSRSMGDLGTAVAGYEKVHSLDPKNLEAIIQLARIYQQLEMHTAADTLIASGLALDTINPKLLMYAAQSAYKQKNYDGVISSLNQLLYSTQDTSVYALKLLGISYFHTQETERAIVALEHAVQKEDDSEIVHYYLGLAYGDSGDVEKSIHHFELAIDQGMSDNLPAYYTNLAIAFEEKGMFSESIRAYQAAYKNSKDKILLYHLARNYDSFYEDKKIALKYYEKYMAANDTDNVRFKDYTQHRITELKRVIHFDIDTLE